jgi:hypothetical protein
LSPPPTNNLHFSLPGVVLVPDLIGSGNRFQTLDTLALGANVNVNIPADVEDKAVALVHGRHGRIDLLHSNISGTFNLEQSFFEGVGVDMLETGSDATWKVSDSIFKVRQE